MKYNGQELAEDEYIVITDKEVLVKRRNNTKQDQNKAIQENKHIVTFKIGDKVGLKYIWNKDPTPYIIIAIDQTVAWLKYDGTNDCDFQSYYKTVSLINNSDLRIWE
jgi:hypothetical protein